MVRHNMHVIEHTYVSLLADVAIKTGFSEIRGSYIDLQWALHEAPKLEKYALECIESGQKLDDMLFPRGLRRLAAGSQRDPVQLRYLRQLLLFCYKASVPHDNKTTEKAFQGFLDTNTATGRFGSDLARVSPRLLDSVRRLCHSVLYQFREKAIKPSHGPGAVTNSKEEWNNRYSTIEAIYPYSDWFSLYYNEDQLGRWESVNDADQIEAKVIAVPKDSRGPRLICVHPAESIWIQQGVRRELERCIKMHRPGHLNRWAPKGHIHFDDQSVNGRIALLSSKSRRYATIDMKEASDRISETLVQILFGRKYKYFGCCRAQKFRIPHLGTLKDLRGDIYSYAPMGNATTFPVQSLVFWAICVASLQRQGFHQPRAVFVFGDDIIIPSEAVEVVIDDLESFGLLVNRTKSFWRGAFRESCGVDAFNGVNVTPVRWKTTVDAEHIEDLQPLSDLAMRLRIAGYEEAAISTYNTLRRRLRSIRTEQLTPEWRVQIWRNIRSKGKHIPFPDKFPLSLPVTQNVEHGGIAEYVTRDSEAWSEAVWHRDLQWYHNRVLRLKWSEKLSHSSGWNHVLESVCSLERAGSGEIPTRPVSRQAMLDRGWIRIS